MAHYENSLREQFRLEGEDVIRLATGQKVTAKQQPSGYRYVTFTSSSGQKRLVRYHRLKFFLAHGYLPKLVDHRDRDRGNDLLSNLRAATKSENGMNAMRPKPSGLPRGVFPNGKRWRAEGTVSGKTHHLGTYATPEEAAVVAETWRRENHGEFYAPSV